MGKTSLEFDAIPAPASKPVGLLRFGGVGRQIASGAAWTGAGAAAAQLSSLGAGILIARQLGKESYGKFGLLQTTVAVGSLFTGFGMSLTATRYLSHHRVTRPVEAGRVVGSTATISLVLTAALCVVFYLFASPISRGLSRRGDLARLIEICTLALFASSLLGVAQGVLTGFESFHTASLTNLVRGLLLIPLLVVGMRAAGLAGALCAMGISSAAGCALAVWFIAVECRRHGIRPAWAVRRHDLAMIRDCALPTFLTGLLVTPANWLVSAAIVRSPGGYAELAILTAGVYFRTALLFFQNMTGAVLLPIFSSHTRAARDSVLLSTTVMNAAVGFIALAAVSIAPGLPMRLFGSGFQGHSGVVMANVACGALLLASAPVVYYLTGAGFLWTIMASNAVWAVLYFAGSLYAIRAGWGALGVALGCLVSYLAQCLFLLASFVWARRSSTAC